MPRFNISHSGNAGDIIHHSACMAGVAARYQTKPHLFLKINQPAAYASNIAHPCGNVMMTEEVALMLLPLLKQQPYFSDVSIWRNEPIDLDFDLFRSIDMDLGKGCITKWPFFAIQSWYDLSKPWLFVTPNESYKDTIIVNRTFRYRNPNINFKFLAGREDVVFVGLPEEYADFRLQCPDAAYKRVESFLELARMLAGCRTFIGNQSMAYAICEGLKCNRILEVSLKCPNVISTGGFCIDVINQGAMETSVDHINYLLTQPGMCLE